MAWEGVDALVMAGGRLNGAFPREAGADVKALASVGGAPILRVVVEALRGASHVRRVCVVGPEAVRAALPDWSDECIWQEERDSAVANMLAGFERLGVHEQSTVLLCGADVAALHAEAVDDLLARAAPEADVVLPVIRREAFDRHYPGNRSKYVRLAEGSFTAGSQFLVRPLVLLENLPLLENLFAGRKSQLRMTRTLGVGFVWKLLTRRLTVPELESRFSTLTGCHCRALLDCRPELAFDIDSVEDLRYLRRRGASDPE